MNPAQRFLAKVLGRKAYVPAIATCPKCGDKITVDASNLGNELRCPGCDKPFAITEARPLLSRTRPKKSQLTDGRVIVMIGSCVGGLEAADHVEKLLASHGIQAFTKGSRSYAIEVLEIDFEAASKLLRRDREKRRYSIVIHKH